MKTVGQGGVTDRPLQQTVPHHPVSIIVIHVTVTEIYEVIHVLEHMWMLGIQGMFSLGHLNYFGNLNYGFCT